MIFLLRLIKIIVFMKSTLPDDSVEIDREMIL